MSSPSPLHSSLSSALLHPHAGACTCLMGRRARALNLPNAGESSLRVPAPSSLLHERLPAGAALLCSPAGLALLCSRRARAPEGGAGVSAAPASAGPRRRRARADLGGGAPHGRARRGAAGRRGAGDGGRRARARTPNGAVERGRGPRTARPRGSPALPAEVGAPGRPVVDGM